MSFSIEKIISESIYAYALISLDGKVIWRNGSFSQLLGYGNDEPILIKDICTEAETVKTVMGAILEGVCDNVKMDKRYKRKDGAVFWGRVSVSLARNNEDLPCCFFVNIEDVTAAREKSRSLSGTLHGLQVFIEEKKAKS